MTVRFASAVLISAASLAFATRSPAADPTAADPLSAWRTGAQVRPVSTVPGRHTIHSYYLTCPESPDGSQVVFYGSTTPDAQLGNLYVQDRATGKERLIAKDIATEDAHRAACQQWTSNGRRVAYHEVRSDQWRVCTVDLNSGKQTTVAHDRQIGFGNPSDDELPLYGCHWNPGPHRGIELANVETGELRQVIKMEQLQAKYGEQLKEMYGDNAISMFFPVVSPNRQRLFFKLAAGSGGNDFRSKQASVRKGTFVYDLAQEKFLFMRQQWGHPAWHPDSRHIVEVGNMLFDADHGGQRTDIPEIPKPSGSHPSISPDGKLLVTDGRLDAFGGQPGEWGIFVCDLRGGKDRFEIIHRFSQTGGARSWRGNHPHPIFSADSRRIYFNVNDGEFTQLFVAERATDEPAE